LEARRAITSKKNRVVKAKRPSQHRGRFCFSGIRGKGQTGTIMERESVRTAQKIATVVLLAGLGATI